MSNNGYSSRKKQDSSFDDELSDLFGELDNGTPDTGEPSGALDEELSDLFGGDLNFKATMPPIEGDLDQLFGFESTEPTINAASPTADNDNSAFASIFDENEATPIIGDEDFARMTLTPETTPAIANEAQIESDLDDLFGENDASTEFLSNAATDETDDDDVVSGLETLFATSPNIATDQELEADFDHYFSPRDAVPPAATNAISTPVATPAEPHTPAPAPA
ncbi:MAG: hypothetical protein WBB82_08550, partial [Limnothrix sp.]